MSTIIIVCVFSVIFFRVLVSTAKPASEPKQEVSDGNQQSAAQPKKIIGIKTPDDEEPVPTIDEFMHMADEYEAKNNGKSVNYLSKMLGEECVIKQMVNYARYKKGLDEFEKEVVPPDLVLQLVRVLEMSIERALDSGNKELFMKLTEARERILKREVRS